MEKPRFGLARSPFKIRLHAVARRRVSLQLEIALGHAEIDELLVVAVGHLLQILERRARLGVAPRPEQELRAAEIELVTGVLDLILQRVELRPCQRRSLGQRELVVDAHVGGGGLRPVSRRERRAAEPRQHVVGDGGLLHGDPFVDPHRRVEVTGCLRRLARCQGGRDRDVPGRLAIEQLVERAARRRDLTEPELAETR